MTNNRKSKITAQIVADSTAHHGIRLTTFQVRVPKFLLKKIARHRVLSVSFNSSCAIPAKTIRSQVWSDPVMPIEWGSNRSGMVAGDNLVGWRLVVAKLAWNLAAKTACFWHWVLSTIGLHKQHVNRIIEGFVWVDGVISATDWENLFNLRCHPGAQPEFNALACQMRDLLNGNKPQFLIPNTSTSWHLPYIQPEEFKLYCTEDLKQLSASRCARVSYGLKSFDYDRDMNRVDMLLSADPPHLSPFEHVAKVGLTDKKCGNYRAWIQYRKEIE